MMYGCGSDNETAIGDGGRERGVLLGSGEDVGSRTNRGPGLAERRFKRINHPQVRNTEVAHGTGGSPEIERVARGHQDDAQAIEFRGSWQG